MFSGVCDILSENQLLCSLCHKYRQVYLQHRRLITTAYRPTATAVWMVMNTVSQLIALAERAPTAA